MGKLNRIIRAKENKEEIEAQYQKALADTGSTFTDTLRGVSYERALEIMARRDYSFYVVYVHHGLYVHGEHTEYICNVLQDVEEGKEKRVMIWLPPRHSKSMTVSETFPSYFVGRNTERRVIEVSYGDRLAKRFGRLNKAKVKEFGMPVFGVTLSEWGVGSTSSNDWQVATIKEGKLIQQRGGMLSTGIGGSITGEGADLLLIDDPIKNREEAYSAVYRDKIWEEWKNTLRTRLQPGGSIIIILTRWHEDDLAGRLLNPKYRESENDKEEWKIISMPAVCDSENDLLNRKIGQTLWPGYGFDEEWAEQTKNDVGSKTWSSLYQQKPSATEGDLIKRNWWGIYNHNAPPEFIEIIQSWDCAYEEKDNLKGSYTVCTTWGRGFLGYYLLDVYRKQIEYPELIKQMKALYSKWNPSVVIIEYKASGKSAFQSLKLESEIPLLKDNPHKSKIVRLEIVSPLIESGRVFLPDMAPWLFDYIEELSMFPNGEYDDQVDSTSQGLKYFQTRAGKFIATSEDYEQIEGDEESDIVEIEGIRMNKESLPAELVDIDPSTITRDDLQRAILAERYGIAR